MQNIRTKILILSDEREIPITESQYNAIKADQNIWRFSDPITIRDPDTQKILFDWKIWAIKEFRDIKSSYSWWDRCICDFWVRHMMEESCWCMERYGVFPIEFRLKLHEVYPKIYARDLTDSQRSTVLSQIKI